ncbi:hypothetical protein M4951_07025 [Blastopirellula sp. J2-11]|uniref:hypothetical protein n=1 Tax=Blastopirellula sp. J2-11 TaxID=2943192 RepID=UPI0021CA0F78|nr:hypothetical protein [Blastopirellula sp. J2-11]UUO08062.1 hypothetical protein M4951_07025 [Blastopirellula sp. J2-11]
MRYICGRMLQIAGLVLLPLVMLLEFQQVLSFRTMLAGFLFGTALFYLGRVLLGDPRI